MVNEGILASCIENIDYSINHFFCAFYLERNFTPKRASFEPSSYFDPLTLRQPFLAGEERMCKIELFQVLLASSGARPECPGKGAVPGEAGLPPGGRGGRAGPRGRCRAQGVLAEGVHRRAQDRVSEPGETVRGSSYSHQTRTVCGPANTEGRRLGRSSGGGTRYR